MYSKRKNKYSQIKEEKPTLLICAWTKKIMVDDRWMTLEDFLENRCGYQVSHGISDPRLLYRVITS
ncbi:MAG: hypothetical protein AAGA18_13300 [Verrucomicrobiota bacterium]